MNDDLPYDKFLIEQIAADRLPASRQWLAGGDGFPDRRPALLEQSHDIIDDRLDVLSRGTMALTVTCARCHDHKFDPIPTEDYYSLYGVLASSVESRSPSRPSGDDARRRTAAGEPHVFVRGNAGNPGERRAATVPPVLSGETASRSRTAAADWSWPSESPRRTIR